MLKYIFLLINSISILFYNLFFSDGVAVTPKFPTTAKPNSEFVAEVVIKKGSLGGFAKLQVDLPQGLTAKELDSKGGTFSYANGMVKYIWASLPSDDEFTVKFTVVADGTCSGTKQFMGKFSYIANNVKQQNDFGPIDVLFEESSAATTITTSTTPDATTTNTTTTTPTPDITSFQPTKDPNAAVSAHRRITANSETEFTVDLVIFKDNIKGFAKYIDKIPTGFRATVLSSDIASFSFNEQTAKFVWVSLPSAEELKVSYKLTMEEKPSSKVFINGEFSYLENDQTQSIKAPENEIVIPQGPVATTSTPVETPTVTPVETPTTTPVETTSTPSVAVTETPTVTPVETSGATNTPSENTSVSSNRSSSVNFNVQVGAFKNNISINQIAAMYNITDNIRTDMHEGLTKFLIGNYSDYKSARDKRENAKNKGVPGAFVTAYNGGKRITIQEALMITSQKWLR